MTVYTTLNKIHKSQACKNVRQKLLASLNKTQPDNEPLSLTYILDVNGLNGALRCFTTVANEHRNKSILFAVAIAERVLPIYVKKFPNDFRLKRAIQSAKNLTNKKTDKNTLNAADAIFNIWLALAVDLDGLDYTKAAIGFGRAAATSSDSLLATGFNGEVPDGGDALIANWLARIAEVAAEYATFHDIETQIQTTLFRKYF